MDHSNTAEGQIRKKEQNQGVRSQSLIYSDVNPHLNTISHYSLDPITTLSHLY